MSGSRVSVGWSLRGRLLVLWGVVLAMMLSLVGVSPAQAAVVSTVSLSTSPSVAAAAESVVLSGVVTPAPRRTVWLQQLGTTWSTVGSVVTSSDGSYSGAVPAGVAGSNTSYRAVARATATAAQAISTTRTVSVVEATLSLSAPLLAETDVPFTFSGAGYPARPGRAVVVQRLSGSSWTAVGHTTQSLTGDYSAQTSVSSVGSFSYRAVTKSWNGAAAVISATTVVSVQAPDFLLTESTAIAAETVKVTGELAAASSRPITVQRMTAAGWVTVAEATTSSTGSYATSFSAPDIGSYDVRVLAPKVTVAKKVLAEYASAVKTLTVVAQSASLSMPTSLVESETAAATVRLGPVRAGRAVALQVLTSGVWTPVATGVQSGSGTASLTFTAGAPGAYSYRAWTAAANGAPAFTSAVAALEVTAAVPGPVTNVTAIPSSTSVALSWDNPGDASLSGVMIRRAVGATAPGSATSGTLVTDAAKPAVSYTDTGLSSGTQYSYALFAHNATSGIATAGTVTTTTTTVGVLPSITGTVTDAGPTPHGLANVRVNVQSPTTGGYENVTTAGDGTYAVSGLPPASDYRVCFWATGATGGSFDALGYLDQCYDNQPMSGEPTPVTVALGATTTVDDVLVTGGAITGTVSDAAGTHHGLANVSVRVESPTNGRYYGFATTAPDGSYAVQGMPSGTDYHVCFFATGATGGSTDALGYIDQCFDNQPTSETATPVTVTLGASRTGVNAVLAVAGAVSGTVSDAGGTQHGLANVSVSVYSPSTLGNASATTAADGTYTATGLPAATDYQVCFYSAGARGGSSDALGYVDQCYDNQPVSGASTPVVVTRGATHAAIDAALVGSGAISGTVTDAAGTHHGLANVWVSASSSSLWMSKSVLTAADGTYTFTGLTAGTDYTVCFTGDSATGGSSDALGYQDQCYDKQPAGTQTPVVVTLGTLTAGVDAALAVAGTASGGVISGSVSEAGGTQQALVDVWVTATDMSTGGSATAVSAADGTYTLSGLAAGTDWQVCFSASSASGGSSDVLGYVDQCYDNATSAGTPTLVVVTLGSPRTGVNAALGAGGAISGTVSEAGGAGHGLTDVSVSVHSQSTGAYGSAMTAADGSYNVPGLAAGTDYQVCFYATGATGGSSDTLGYADQCYDNQLISGTPTPVTVSVGETRTAVDAALGASIP